MLSDDEADHRFKSALRYLVLALGVVLTWFGLARLRDVPVDVFPEFAPPRVEIRQSVLGFHPPKLNNLSQCRWKTR